MRGPFTDGEADHFYVLTHWLESLSYENRAQLEELFDYRIRMHDYFQLFDSKKLAKVSLDARRLAKEEARRTKLGLETCQRKFSYHRVPTA